MNEVVNYGDVLWEMDCLKCLELNTVDDAGAKPPNTELWMLARDASWSRSWRVESIKTLSHKNAKSFVSMATASLHSPFYFRSSSRS